MHWLKKYWPFLFIFVFWFFFSYPVFLKAKTVYPSTYQMNFFSPWQSYPQFAGPVKNNAMPDIITQIYPWKHFTIEQWKKGQIPLWNPYSFSGTPHLANYQSAVLSPINILFFLFPFLTAWNISVVLQPLLAGIFMYLFMRSLKREEVASLISAISFMFCGFIVTWMDYGTLSYAILFLPLALFSIEKFTQTGKNFFLFLLTCCFPLSFFSGHFQTSIYVLLLTGVYILFVSFREKNIKLFVWLSIYTLFGLLISMPQVLPSLEFYTQSVRSSLFQKVEVIPWGYLPTFFAPDFYGNPVTRNDWYGHYAEWNGYLGLAGLMLGIYSFRKINKTVIFFGSCALVTFLLAFPSPLLNAMVAMHIPVLSTSSASRIIVLFSFCLSVLAAFGFELLAYDIKRRNIKPITIWLGMFSVGFLSLWIVVLKKLYLPLDKILIARQNMLLPTLFYISVVAVIILSFILQKLKKQRLSSIVLTVLLIITAADMFRFVTKWQAFDPSNLVYPQLPVIAGFNKIAGYNRSFGNYGADVAVYYHLPSIEGYDPLYISNYGQLIASMSDGKLQDSYRSAVLFTKNDKYTMPMIKLLNITYIVHKKSDDFVNWTFPYWNYPGQFDLIFEDNAYRIFKNNNALPHAFIVNSLKVITDKQQQLTTLYSQNFNPGSQAIVTTDPKISFNAKNVSSVNITDYTPNKVTLNVSSQYQAFLVLLDNTYPGWNAYVDGQKTQIFTTDYTFRGIKIPSGNHLVVFSYQPVSFTIGLWLSFIGIVGVVVGLVIKKGRFTRI